TLEPAEPAAHARIVAAAIAFEHELPLGRIELPHGTSVGMPRRRQNLASSPRSQAVAFVDHGLRAPAASVRRGSGTTRARSRSITRPKPRHASHAPSGLLKENRLGTGSRTAKPHAAHSRAVEKRTACPPSTSTTGARPRPRSHARPRA